jgi:hypothetical protein
MMHRNYPQFEAMLTHVAAFSNFCFETTRKKTGGTSNRSCKLQLVSRKRRIAFRVSFWWVLWIRKFLPVQESVNKSKAMLNAVELAESFANPAF